jgi:two-component system phosphate regulon sensor histidine kinase PhoR
MNDGDATIPGGQAATQSRWCFVGAGSAAVAACVSAMVGAMGWLAAPLLISAGVLVWCGVRFRDRSTSARSDAHWKDELLRAEGARVARTRELERAYRELSTFLEIIDEPILVFDDQQLVVLVNEAARAWLDMAAEDALGRRVDEVFTNAEVLSMHAKASRGALSRRRVTLAGENGFRVADVSAVPMPPDEASGPDRGRGVLLVLRDVTELARALQVRTDFAANASHELRTPIASLRGAVDTLHGPAAGDEKMRERLLSMLDENVSRLEDLIRDLLDLSRLEAMEGSARLSLVPASELARVLGESFESMCERGGISLRFEFDQTLEELRTDRNLLTIVLRNLIENAIKFSSEGDEVLVRGLVEDTESGRGRRPCVFEVIDHGQGIPLPMQQRIFERFYQVDQSRDGSKIARGTGLGLAIVKHAVRTLGGAIKVKSVWQRGTTMRVELPGALPPRERSAGSGGPSAA